MSSHTCIAPAWLDVAEAEGRGARASSLPLAAAAAGDQPLASATRLPSDDLRAQLSRSRILGRLGCRAALSSSVRVLRAMESRLERVHSGLVGGGSATGSSSPGLGAASSAAAAATVEQGSGAFNEKAKQAEKNAALSHLLFSTFGLDHFPRYLSRWSLEEVDALEAQLATQLELVRQQKAAMVASAADNVPYQRRFIHEEGLDLDSVLAPEFAAIVRRGGIAKNRAAFLRLLEQEDGEGFVYSFPLLNPEFCARLVEEANAFRSFHASLPPGPGQSGSSGSGALKHFGMRRLDECLLTELLEPLSALIFPSMLENAKLDWCHGYVASYEAAAEGADVDAAGGREGVAASATAAGGGGGGGEGADDADGIESSKRRQFGDKLNAHTDDSEVTLNVGLVDTFTGGELHFRNIRGACVLKYTQPAMRTHSLTHSRARAWTRARAHGRAHARTHTQEDIRGRSAPESQPEPATKYTCAVSVHVLLRCGAVGQKGRIGRARQSRSRTSRRLASV